MLADYLGITQVIWLEHGFEGDPSGGHVDNVACFIRPGVVMALTSRDKDDANFAGLQDNLARLRAARDAAGRELEVIEIEQPAARFRPDGRRLTMSYLNFYLANGAVLLPMFGDAKDDAAYAAIKAAFPDRQAIQIDATDLVYGGGGIHCITQQQPAVRRAIQGIGRGPAGEHRVQVVQAAKAHGVSGLDRSAAEVRQKEAIAARAIAGVEIGSPS